MMTAAQEKAPGNDGLTKEFCSCFWEELKESLLPSLELQNAKWNSLHPKNKLLSN